MIGGLIGVLINAVPPASGEGARPDPGQEEAIVVTGERVSRSLRETPSSVAVITADMIEKRPDADRLDTILEAIPNVQAGSGANGPTIRGQDSTGVLQDLPAFLGGTRSRVSLQVDGRAVGYNEFVFGVAPLWDVQQIEVFRSPQTTTQGRNSIAGAIFVSTKDPTYQPEARGRAIVGSRSLRQLSAVASGPIVDDQLAFRLAGDIRRGRTASRITDGMPGANPNRDDYSLLRFKLLAEPRSLPGMRLEASYARTEASSPQTERVVAPFRERRDPAPGYGVFQTRVDALTARLDAELGEALAMATTLSLGRGRAKRFPIPGLGRAVNRTDDLSVETILTWTGGEHFRLLGGVHHLRSKLDQTIDLTAVLGNGAFVDRQRSFGVFGEAAFQPLPWLTATAGIRYQTDRQKRLGSLGEGALILPIDFDGSFGAWLPKVSLAYDVTGDITAGVLVQRAYHPGGTALNFDTREQDDFDAETLWSFEIFTRGAFLDGRLRLTANIFRNQFRDAQRATTRAFRIPGGPTAFWAEIDNVPKAWSHGLEAAADWQATERLGLRGAIGLLETKITDTNDPANPIRGRAFQRSPAVSGSASVEWMPFDRLRVSASVRHHGDYYSDDANTPSREIESATFVDARAALDVGPVSVFGYARNLLDDFALTYLFSPTAGTAAKPRELGIGLEANF